MDPDINEAIAKLVEGRRIHLGMSRAELALASGVSFSTLDRLERQHRGCSAADLWRIAQVLGVSMTELCGSATGASSPPSSFKTEGDPDFGARKSERPGGHAASDGYSGRPH
ncbi:helix-turn-helix transcriptional regulator [Phenylobacterium sp.]|jgi:transcriptional regulator with XRE-family HTH domain|uniref:helix-turn-helix domain-containing protein n=1 Tax=Phenylobacterium sp. TaxID=1871053 RepID=UPI002E30980D|nr:helix-turn-helix transcriptional regulator [Phenylobacterium sp.]HEX4711044.1 helix-turn-helix transcriptional regulator [Phenylobacterium sp.]